MTSARDEQFEFIPGQPGFKSGWSVLNQVKPVRNQVAPVINQVSPILNLVNLVLSHVKLVVQDVSPIYHVSPV